MNALHWLRAQRHARVFGFVGLILLLSLDRTAGATDLHVDPQAEEIEIGKGIMRRYRNTFRELAK